MVVCSKKYSKFFSVKLYDITVELKLSGVVGLHVLSGPAERTSVLCGYSHPAVGPISVDHSW